MFDVEPVTVHWYISPSFPSVIISLVVAVYMSLPIYSRLPTGCMLLVRLDLYPSGPVTVKLRAIPPVDVHCTLNSPYLAETTRILVVNEETIENRSEHYSIVTLRGVYNSLG